MIFFDKVSIFFDHVPILTDVNLSIKDGEFVSIVGESGVGKTTLLRLMYFDVFPDKGTVTIDNKNSSKIKKRDIQKIRKKIGVVFQDYKLLEDRNVFENVALSLEIEGINKHHIGKRVLRALADVGLSHKRNDMPRQLSGGEQQRVTFARAIVRDPIVLLADEPTGNLDRSAEEEIVKILKKISTNGTIVVLATHNIELVKKAGGRIIQIKDGKVTEIENK
jgi:cell division transport system ATP-binding protein